MPPGLAGRAEQWSCGSCHVREHRGHALRPLLAAWPVSRPRNWLQRVNTPITPAEVAEMKQHIARGRPLGDRTWVVRTAKALRLQQTLRPRGRQPGWRKPNGEKRSC